VVGCCLPVGAHGGQSLGAREAGERSRDLAVLWKMVFWLVRMNSLGREPQLGRSLAEADTFALEITRAEHPEFTPALIG